MDWADLGAKASLPEARISSSFRHIFIVCPIFHSMNIGEFFYPRLGKIVLSVLLVLVFVPFLSIAGPNQLGVQGTDATFLSFILQQGNQILGYNQQMLLVSLAVSYLLSCLISNFTVKMEK